MSPSFSAAAHERLVPPLHSCKKFQSPARQTAFACLILVVLVLLCYSPITHNGFLRYDDDGYITDNPHVKAGLSWPTVKWAFSTYEQANWHPLTWLSHALDWELFGPNPRGHHYVNLLLHAANAILLFLLLQSASGFRWRGSMVAALFAVHPINVESVAWAAERKNVLSMLFFLLALYAYGWYARQPQISRYAAVFVFFALALMSKPQAITFPLLLFLWDYWPLDRYGSGAKNGSGWLILEKVPLLVLSAASAVVTMKAQRAGNALQTFAVYSAPLRVETAVISYVRYLEKAFWPSRLVGLYPHPTNLYPAPQVAGAVILLVLITAVVILRARKQRYLAVGWFWFLGSLVPMLGLVQVGFQGMADRYAYIPFVGLFLMVTWLAADLAIYAKRGANPDTVRWLAAPAAVCLLALGVLTYGQVRYWQNTESFWLRTIALTRNNYVAEDNLGEFLYSQNRIDQAATHFRAALAIHPEDVAANLNLGAYENRRGNFDAALLRYKTVASQSGDASMRAIAYGGLGFVYRQIGRPMDAKECFETALQLEPKQARARVGLGLIALDAGNAVEAVHQYSLALALQPNSVLYLLMAQALQQSGRPEEAKAIYERLARSPNFAEVQEQAQLLISRK